MGFFKNMVKAALEEDDREERRSCFRSCRAAPFEKVLRNSIRRILLISQMDIKLISGYVVVRQIKPSRCRSCSRCGSPAVCP